MGADEERDYHSFLLRMRRVQENARPAWRFSLHPPGGGEVRRFSTWGALVAFIQALMAEPARDPTASQKEDRDARRDLPSS